MSRQVVIGSRGSKLALWQARHVADLLEAEGATSRIEIIRTTGDKITDVSLAQVATSSGIKGVFTKELEQALLAGTIDLAVHSLKDMPTELPEGLTLAAVPRREDPRDALVGACLDDLCDGARIGTGSLRRAAQLRALRPDLEILDIRGNVDTRLRKLDEGRFDAIVLACAGLRRLGLADRITQAMEASQMASAVGQGALALEVREGDDEIEGILRPLHHEATAVEVKAERALLAKLGGGCQVPMGARAEVAADQLRLSAAVASQDGTLVLRAALEGAASDAALLGEAAADDLLNQGGRDLL